MAWIEILWESMALQIALALFGVIGTIWGFYSHGVSNRKQCFATKYLSYDIIKQGKNTIENLELTFAGKKIHDLTITQFAIWNCGNKVINGTDMVPTQKLRVVATEKTEILEAEIVTESDNSNCFNICDKSNNEIRLDFDYVDSREGIVLQVLHTGGLDSIKIEGKIKGGKPIKQIGPDVKNKKRSPKAGKRINKLLAVLLAVEEVVLFAMTCLITLIEMKVIPKETVISYMNLGMPTNRVFAVLISWVLVAMLFAIVLKVWRSAFMIGVPSKLRILWE